MIIMSLLISDVLFKPNTRKEQTISVCSSELRWRLTSPDDTKVWAVAVTMETTALEGEML